MTKRRYTRLSPATWSEIRAHWELGEVTLPELADRYAVAERTLQSHFAKHRTVKGAKAAEVAATIRQKVFEEELPDVDLVKGRAKDVRERAYRNATALEELVMNQVEIARSDPGQAMRAATIIKGLAIAANALDRLHDLKFRALGLDKVVDEEELPVLRIIELSAVEEEEMRNGHASDENLDEIVDDDGAEVRSEPSQSSESGCINEVGEPDVDIVQEGFDEVENETEAYGERRHDDHAARDEDGYRIVRATPGTAPEMRVAPVESALAREAKP